LPSRVYTGNIDSTKLPIVNYFVGKGLMRAFQTTTFGEANRDKTRRVTEIVEMFNRAGIPSVYCSDMDAWQKTHVAMITNIANALYRHDCNNRQLAASWSDVKEMVLGIKEGFAVLKRLGIRPTPRKLGLFNLPSCIITIAFKIFMGTQLAEITMAKHCSAAKTEMVSLQEEFDQLIDKSGMKTPYIDLLRQNLICTKRV
jgi:2-dehydropantoate 2-reductase